MAPGSSCYVSGWVFFSSMMLWVTQIMREEDRERGRGWGWVGRLLLLLPLLTVILLFLCLLALASTLAKAEVAESGVVEEEPKAKRRKVKGTTKTQGRTKPKVLKGMLTSQSIVYFMFWNTPLGALLFYFHFIYSCFRYYCTFSFSVVTLPHLRPWALLWTHCIFVCVVLSVCPTRCILPPGLLTGILSVGNYFFRLMVL